MRRDGLALGAVVLLLLSSLAVAVAVDTEPVQNDISLTTNSGVSVVTDDHGGGMELTTPFVDDETVALQTDNGNLTVSGPATASLRVDSIGMPVGVSEMNVAGTNVTLTPPSANAISLGGDIDNATYYSSTPDDGETDLRYAGTSGTTFVTFTGLTADRYYAAEDVDTGESLGIAQANSSGAVTFELPNSEHSIQLQTSSPTAPDIQDETASPVGTQSNDPTTLSVNVSDPDFPTDEVNISFTLDGTDLGNDTLTQAGEASVSIPSNLQTAGEHEWTVTATDQFGRTSTSTFEYGGPAEVTIRNETDPNTIIDGQQVEAELAIGDDVFRRTTSDGNFSLAGLPTGEEVAMTVTSDGYRPRTVTFDSIAQAQTVYLLNQNATSVEVRFQLDDRTGNFPSESSELIIKKPITQDGTTTYRRLASSTFGVNGYSIFLSEGQRYRLSVQNDNGQIRDLGTYTPTVSETVTLRIENSEFSFDRETENYRWGARLENKTVVQNGQEVEQPFIRFEFSDNESLTDSLTLEIYEQGNESNVIVRETYRDVGDLSADFELSDDQANQTWVVSFDGQRAGDSISGAIPVGQNRLVPLQNIDPFWSGTFGVIFLLVVAGTIGSSANAEIAAVITSVTAGLLVLIGFMPAGVTMGFVLVALFVAVLFRIRSTGAVQGGGL